MAIEPANETDELLGPPLTPGGHPRIRKVSELYTVDVESDEGTPAASSQEERDRAVAKKRLIFASIICVLFMIGEVLGGYFSGSLAIMTDAAHMLSDFASFLISLFALWIAGRPPSRTMSFGYARAEILGAIMSVFLIWVLTGVLVYEAIQRVITPEPVDGKIMFITAVAGLGANIIMAVALGHGHGHGVGGGHGQSHSRPSTRPPSPQERGADKGHGHGHESAKEKENHGHSHGGGANVNVRAAFIHVLGDMVQSVGVIIASAIIWAKPHLTIVDPMCTFLFSVLVLFTTFTLLKDTVNVLMEGTPAGVDPTLLTRDLEAIPGVAKAHDVHIWSITVGKPASSIHLMLTANPDRGNVLLAAQRLLCEKYGIHHTTIQLEEPDVESHCMGGDDCNTVCPTVGIASDLQ
eukprot:comp22204_c0_seq1/m.32661 comp22204_c0_seq1/g.32661  ORF comp22204_c0_seq1/g.32661 comp22204_c0_seq1/m.32661 type:complete len:408 (-) comp22204_c0_seq1:350-1573(-)